MTLREKQSEFLHTLVRFIQWAFDQGYELTLADGSIDAVRRVRLESGFVVKARDVTHLEDGQHYRRLAQDLNLFINGVWITDGGHPAWAALGRKWKSLDSLARWGGDFPDVDSNHFSFEHEDHA